VDASLDESGAAGEADVHGVEAIAAFDVEHAGRALDVERVVAVNPSVVAGFDRGERPARPATEERVFHSESAARIAAPGVDVQVARVRGLVLDLASGGEAADVAPAVTHTHLDVARRDVLLIVNGQRRVAGRVEEGDVGGDFLRGAVEAIAHNQAF